MSQSSAIICCEVFDEHSQPSAEGEVSEYAQQIGIDPESESHLLPLAKEGLMQPLPPPWKAYLDQRLQTHYYYNEETKKTQWEHPLDNVYRELVKKAKDTSMLDDTCASVQEIWESEDNTKQLDQAETKADSNDEFSTESESHSSNNKDLGLAKRHIPMNRPSTVKPLDKKLQDLKMSSLRRSVDGSFSLHSNQSKEPRSLDGPKLFKQQSEIIDLKMHVMKSPIEDTYSSLPITRPVHGLTLTGKGSMFLKKNDLPSPDTEKSFPLDSVTKSDPLKGILREKMSDSLHKKAGSFTLNKSRSAVNFDDDKKSVRFKLENSVEPILSPGSNSSSNDGQSSIISNTPSIPLMPSQGNIALIPSPSVPSSILNPLKLTSSSFFTSSPSTASLATSSLYVAPSSISMTSTNLSITSMNKIAPITQKLSSIAPLTNPSRLGSVAPSLAPIVPKLTPIAPIGSVLVPLASRPPLPPRPQNSEGSLVSPRENSKSGSGSDKESAEHESISYRSDASPKRRLIRPPAADYIKPDLFQKNFQKISDLVKVGDIDPTPVNLEEPSSTEKEVRPRSPRIPQQKNKISINLMESIESETSIDSPDREFANLDLNDMGNNDLDTDNESEASDEPVPSQSPKQKETTMENKEQNSPRETTVIKSMKPTDNIKRFDFRSISDDARYSRDNSNVTSRTSIDSVDGSLKLNLIKTTEVLSPKEKSPKDFGHNWTMSSYRPGLNKAFVSPPLKSDSNISLKSPSTPRIDGVIIQGSKLNKDSDVMVMYQFEQPKEIASPNIDTKSNQKTKEERKLFESHLEKELEDMRIECSRLESKRKCDLEDELKVNEEIFKQEKQNALSEQAEKHRREIEEAVKENESRFENTVMTMRQQIDERLRIETEKIDREFRNKMAALHGELSKKLEDKKTHLQIENEQALTEIAEQLQIDLNNEKSRLIEENKIAIESLKEEHTARLNELKQDYRVEIERLRSQHLCHIEELRVKLASERAAGAKRDDLPDKYKCLKEKYARLKHDVKTSIERRNKRREMSMTTGSETEKSNSHRVAQANGDRCKEANETSSSAMIEQEPSQTKLKVNNNPTIKFNDNETSLSDSNAQKTSENNNFNILSPETSVTSAERPPPRAPRKLNSVAFKDPPTRRKKERESRDRYRDRGDQGTTTDCQDSSDATTADEKTKEPMNDRNRSFTGHGRRRCFTRLKSASTSRLNYSPNRKDEGWSSPLESLRQQLRKLDDLEDQFPDLACQPAYTMRYPFNELGVMGACRSPELEFVRHRAVVEREGMRRARAVLRQRKAALTHEQPQERDATEMEVGLHRARALLGEKEIRLRHIERSLRQLADSRTNTPATAQEELDDVSTASDVEAVESASDAAANGAVLRSLRALHADVRDIWRALDTRRTNTASPETSSYNPQSTSQPRMSMSMQETAQQDRSEGSLAERARGLRAWLQTTP